MARQPVFFRFPAAAFALFSAFALWLAGEHQLRAQEFSARQTPGDAPEARVPVRPGPSADGALVAAARGGTRHAPESPESQKYVDRDPEDPFQRPERRARPVGIRFFILEFW